MKRILFWGVLLSSSVVFAQTTEEKVVAKDMLGNDSTFEEAFPFVNMKVFHDREIMKEVLVGLYAQQIILNNSDDIRPQMTKGIYSEKDSEIMEGVMNKTSVQYNLEEESFDKLIEKADEDPEEAFKELLLNSSFAKIKPEEMKKLNEVDKETISKATQIITESGPDVGAKPVPVLYKNETQK